MSVKMKDTAVIGVIERVRHPRYAKTVQRTKRLYAHNTDTELKPGDRVRVQETFIFPWGVGTSPSIHCNPPSEGWIS